MGQDLTLRAQIINRFVFAVSKRRGAEEGMFMTSSPVPLDKGHLALDISAG
jgi:hypothetical protein